jgi:hypothetical protein
LRILLDESLPRSFAAEIEGHEVSTLHAEGWLGLRNGVLLRAAVDAGYEVLIPRDQSIPHQQNLRKIGISVLVVAGVTSHVERLRLLVTQITSLLPLLRRGDFYEIRPLKGDVICDAA